MTEVAKTEMVYLGPGDNDFYETMKAALAVPGCYPSAVHLGGCEYMDGGKINPLQVRRFQKVEDLELYASFPGLLIVMSNQ